MSFPQIEPRPLDAIQQDVRDAWRSVRRSPGFTITAVLVLAAALAVNAAVFSLINVLVFRPLPVSRPDELAFIYTPADFRVAIPLYRDYLEFPESQHVFSGVLATGGDTTRIIRGAESQRVAGERVSANYFEVLGVAPLLGRTFSADEATSPASAPVVVISASMWRSIFSSDAAILGKTLDLEIGRTWSGLYSPTRKYTIVGVMPDGFSGLSAPWEPVDYWVPLVQRAPDRYIGMAPNVPGRPADPVAQAPIRMVGRLRPGVTFDEAAAATLAAGHRMRQTHYPRYTAGSASGEFNLVLEDRLRTRLPFDATRGSIVPSQFALVVAAVSACLLIVAVGNLVGLLRARAVSRAAEIAIRATLGASRGRIARQMLTESLMVSLAGGVLGLVFSRWLVQFVLLQTPSSQGAQFARLAFDLPLDWRVLGVSFGLCLLAGLVTGLAPVRQVTRATQLGELASTQSGSSRHARRRLRHWIAVPQLAVSLVLLMVGGSLVRALLIAQSSRPGYNAEDVVMLAFERPSPPFTVRNVTAEAETRWAAGLAAANRRLLEAIPATGATAASLISDSPNGIPVAPAMTWAIARKDFGTERRWWIGRESVSPGYFDTLQIPMRYGRTFEPRDGADAPKVTVISDALAAQMWPDANPIGEYLAFQSPGSTYPLEWLEVVGVVGSVTPPLAGHPMATAYTTADQSLWPSSNGVIARGTDPPAMLIRKLSQAIHAADATAVISQARTLRDAENALLFTRRFAVGLVGASGLAALVLAALGLYGVISFSVAQRMQEIGIRAALGATRRDLLRLVMREGALVVATGLVIGVPLAIGAAKVAKSVIAALPPLDVLSSTGMCLLIVGVILVACYVPARRASRADPLTVLRQL